MEWESVGNVSAKCVRLLRERWRHERRDLRGGKTRKALNTMPRLM